MGDVTSIARKAQGGPPTIGAHIDSISYALLVEILIGYLELRIAAWDAGQSCEGQEQLNERLAALAQRFAAPKGAA